MIKGKWLKLILTVAVTTTLLLGNSLLSYAEWEKTGDGRWRFQEEMDYATGWREIGDTWYYFDSRGFMVTGWVEIGENWYFFDEIGGTMASETWVDGYYLNKDGIWQPNGPDNTVQINGDTVSDLLKAAFARMKIYPGAEVLVESETVNQITVNVGEELSPVLFKSFVSYTVDKNTGIATSKTGGPEIYLK